MNQRKYVLDLLHDTGFIHAKPAATPMVATSRLSNDSGDLLPDNSLYRKLIGKLLYLCTTRPNITHAVQQLSQYLDRPTTIHRTVAHRVLRYLKASPGKGLFFSTDSSLQIKSFSDSDWATCPDSRKSVSGYCVSLVIP